MKTVVLAGHDVVIDDDDLDLVLLLSPWHVGGTGRYFYRAEYIGGKTVKQCLHRILAHTPGGMDTDHINRNPFDCRKTNLRVCSRRVNNVNRKRRGDNTSGYIGVVWSHRQRDWSAWISVKGKNLFVGRCKSKERAFWLRSRAEEFWGYDVCELKEHTNVEWESYRQALRDITEQAGFSDSVEWPVKPV